MSTTLKRTLLPVAIVLGGATVAVLLTTSREAPPRVEHENPGPLVETLVVEPDELTVVVRGNGTVEPLSTVQVVPQVAGRVVAIHPQLVNGGVVGANQPLVQIETVDYELALERAGADVARAQVQLELAEAEAAIAVEEWARLHPDEAAPALVAREPQVAQARADLAASRAAVAAARLDLDRTTIALPNAVRIVSESIDVGQFTTVGQPLATAYELNAVEIPVPLHDADLAWFEVPGPGTGSRGADADVTATFAGERQTWRGRVVRTEGEIDRQTRMVRVVVRVQRPSGGPGGHLVPGMFVDVAIRGRRLPSIAVIPRDALHPGETVWLVRDGRLVIQMVDALRREHDRVLVGGGLTAGDVVVTSQLDVVTEGMKVRPTSGGGQ